MSTYIKKYDVGNIAMDLPYNSFIHELPILRFKDFRNRVNLSVVFNYKLKYDESNIFNMGEGFKLNIQKRVVKNVSGQPVKFIDANGKYIDLVSNSNYQNQNSTVILNNLYTFDDDSKRVLRITSTGFEVEYEDLAKEVYNSSGDIISIYDRFGDLYLTYDYESGKLKRINYNGKQVLFEYYNNEITSISYSGTTTTLVYNHPNLSIIHYSGVKYYMTVGDTSYIAKASALEGSASVYKIKQCEFSGNNIILTSKVGADVVDLVTYEYPSTVIDVYKTYSQVVVTNKKGVKQRIQFDGNTPLCSYEINNNNDVEFYEDSCVTNVNIYKTLDTSIINSFNGIMKYDDGTEMTRDTVTTNRYYSDVTTVDNSNTKGSFLLTGWIKTPTADTSKPIYVSNHTGGYDFGFYAHATEANKWYFFSCQFELDANFIYVFADQVGVELKDLRLSYKNPHIIDANDKTHAVYKEGVLIDKSTNEVIPFSKVTFNYSTEGPSGTICLSFSDMMRYIKRSVTLNKSDEIIYNDGKNAINELLYIQVNYNNTTKLLSEYNFGYRYYNNGAEYYVEYEKINLTTEKVLVRNYKGGVRYSYHYLNKYFDVIQLEEDDISRYYTRDKGLITREQCGSLYNLTYTYNTTNNTILIKDEYGDGVALSGVTHFVDSNWGKIYKSQTSNGTKIKDSYDDDMNVILNKEFNKQTLGINHLYEYDEGNLTSLSCDDLIYNLEYDKGKLSKISKCGTSIEELTHSDYFTTEYYPSQSSAIYSKEYCYDKYNRLSRITDVLDNTFDIYSSFNSSTGEPYLYSLNGSTKLVMSEDLVSGKKERFYYDDQELLAKKTVTSASDYLAKNSEETFEYDKAKRLKYKKLIYDIDNDSYVEDIITYVKTEDDPLIDERVSSYGYNINLLRMVTSTYEYDSYKRLTKKIYDFMSGLDAEKNYTITRNRVSNESNKINNSLASSVNYSYDDFGRISSITSNNKTVTYEYDDYGRLIRENNQPLDKTIIYGYNNIGNIVSNTTYAYTVATNPATLRSSKTYEYDSTQKDKLITFNGTSIPYNALGCPTSYKGYSLSWDKGKLVRLSKGNIQTGQERYIYNYNAYGQRTSKSYSMIVSPNGLTSVAQGTVTSFDKKYNYDHAGRLINETGTVTYYGDGTYNESIEYIYDSSSIIGIRYKHGSTINTYYFDRNIFGDVVAIYDMEGNLKVKYLYDAFGNCTVSSETTDYSLARKNPIRYRGYYFDVESQLFYCNSRYYSPDFCRFISPDSIEYLDPSSINGLNLYCYCYNDPINYYDPSGHLAITTLIVLGLIGVGAAVGGVVAGISSYNNGNTGWELVGDILGGVLIGGAIGGIIGYFAAPSIAALLSSTGTIGGALAFAGGMGSSGAGIAISTVGEIALLGTATMVGLLSGIIVMAAQTNKSGGYYGERWPGDPHKPDHVHLRGNGIDIRIGKDGKPLPGEDKLGSQARKALKRLWHEFVELFNRW